uniref:Uncharacterized protein n=1 Tax=Opuntia streptacantha TaxID=393608 RepID=A0A7C9A6M1_OPUST
MTATEAKNIAKKPPAAAKDIKNETMTVLIVAAAKNSRKTRTPVIVSRVIVPTEITRSNRRKLPRRAQLRTFDPEVLEASRRRGRWSFKETLTLCNNDKEAKLLLGSGKKIEERRLETTTYKLSGSASPPRFLKSFVEL